MNKVLIVNLKSFYIDAARRDSDAMYKFSNGIKNLLGMILTAYIYIYYFVNNNFKRLD